MKRNLLNGLVAVAMLGAAASANAFLLPVQGHVGGTGIVGASGSGAQLDITGLNGAAGFTETLSLRTGDSVNFSGFGGLGGMTAGQSVYADRITATGMFAYDFDGATGFGSPFGTSNDIFGYLNQVVFAGDATTTITGGTVPGSILSTTASGSGSFSTHYSGVFSALPGTNPMVAGINTALQTGSVVSGQLDVTWQMLAAGVLQMTITDSGLSSGWGGYEGLFSAVDAMGNADNQINGKLYMGTGIYGSGPNTGKLTPGNFVIAAVPEPASLALLGLGVAGLGFMRRRKV